MVRRLLFFLTFITVQSYAQVSVEYIAHASFIIQSAGGVRVAIDPYNGKHSLGYYFPDNQEADVVAVTHPHFDHDANYYFGAQTPVITEPGQYQFGDVVITGMEAQHAGSLRFINNGVNPYNVIWKIETGGIEFLHLGDNEVLSEQLLTEIGEIDVLMIQIFKGHHYYDDESFKRVLDLLDPSFVIPMHYRLTALSDIPSWTGDVDSWLTQQPNSVALDTNRISIRRKDMVQTQKIIKFKHAPEVKKWEPQVRESWDIFLSVRTKMRAEDPDFRSLDYQMIEAIEKAPHFLIYYNLRAQILDSLRVPEEVIPLLETGLTNAGLDDWEQQLLARSTLGRLYLAKGERAKAIEQFRWIATLERTYQQDLKDVARAYLKQLSKD